MPTGKPRPNATATSLQPPKPPVTSFTQQSPIHHPIPQPHKVNGREPSATKGKRKLVTPTSHTQKPTVKPNSKPTSSSKAPKAQPKCYNEKQTRSRVASPPQWPTQILPYSPYNLDSAGCSNTPSPFKLKQKHTRHTLLLPLPQTNSLLPTHLNLALRMPWAIWHKNKAVELGDSMINNIRWDPLIIYRWTSKELLEAWSFIFPLTEKSMQDGRLPLTDSTWHYTPNPWWRFTLDQLPLLLLGLRTSNNSKCLLESKLSEASLDLMEREIMPLEICQRKFLTRESTGVLIQGILPQLKLIQTMVATASFTIGTLTKQTQLNLLEHAITLMSGTHVDKENLG